jgi:hypothetical protein
LVSQFFVYKGVGALVPTPPLSVVNGLGLSLILDFAHAVAFCARFGPKTGREAPDLFHFAAREEAI